MDLYHMRPSASSQLSPPSADCEITPSSLPQLPESVLVTF